MQILLPVVLASGSPRRRDLLEDLLEDFEIFVPEVDEDALTVGDPVETARSLALAKAKAVFAHRQDCLVIGGDTVVSLEGRQYTKPTSKKNAIEILTALSGKTHQVTSGVAVIWPDGEVVESDTTEVTFRVLDRTEIEAYVETGEPQDKAGAYASQGGAAGFIQSMVGSKTNVIGLPIEKLTNILESITAC